MNTYLYAKYTFISKQICRDAIDYAVINLNTFKNTTTKHYTKLTQQVIDFHPNIDFVFNRCKYLFTSLVTLDIRINSILGQAF